VMPSATFEEIARHLSEPITLIVMTEASTGYHTQ